jgi:octaprenyl-diphosphate synthase
MGITMKTKLQISIVTKKFDKKLQEIIHEDLPLLKKIKSHVIESGGKKIRPITHYLFCELYDYKGTSSLDVGAIAELIHGASLLHDDVVDGADTRRGLPTVGKLHGNKTAILAGDYLLACGIQHLNKLQNPLLMDAFTNVIRDLAVGELIQMEWEKKPEITIEIYEKVIYGKTASLFGAVTETAGILSGRPKKEIAELKKFGVTMGMLFQRKDDYIDYFEESQKSGKIPLKDFFNGLYTYPTLILLNKVSKKEVKLIHNLMQKKTKTTKDAETILGFMKQYQVKETILNLLNDDANYLLSFLERFPDNAIKQMIIERIQSIIAI